MFRSSLLLIVAIPLLCSTAEVDSDAKDPDAQSNAGPQQRLPRYRNGNKQLRNPKRLVKPDSPRLRFIVTNHQPCEWTNESKWNEIIKFPNMAKAPLRPDPRQRGCYYLSGVVRVNQTVPRNLKVYVQEWATADESLEPKPCTNYDADGCGGQGSCLYCGSCNEVLEHEAYQHTDPTILINGREANCGMRFRKGRRKHNVRLRFCMPTKQEFFDANDLTEELWHDIMESGHSGGGNVHSIHLKIRVFTGNKNQLLAAERKLREFYQKLRGPGWEPTEQEKKRLAFTQFIVDEKGYIACHKVSGNVIIPRSESD